MIRGFLLALSMVIALVPSPAQAHMALVRSDPADGAVLDQAPHDAVLEFSQPLGQTAYVILTGPNGIIPTPDPMVTGSTLTIAITNAGEGGYRLAFRALSAEGHPLTGAIGYSVGAAPDKQGLVSKEASQATGRGSLMPVVTGVVVLIGGGTGLALWMLRRRRAQDDSAQ